MHQTGLFCLNAPQLGTGFLQDIIAEQCSDCIFQERLNPSPDFPDINADQQLKLLHYQYLSREKVVPSS